MRGRTLGRSRCPVPPPGRQRTGCLRGGRGGPRRAPHLLSPPRSPSRTPGLRAARIPSWSLRAARPEWERRCPRGPPPGAGLSVLPWAREGGEGTPRHIWTGWVQRPSWGRALGLPLAEARGGQKRGARRGAAEPTPQSPFAPRTPLPPPVGFFRAPQPRAHLRAPPGLGPAQHAEPAGVGEGRGCPYLEERARRPPGLARPRGPRPDAAAFPPEPPRRWRRSGPPRPSASPRPRPPARVRSARPAGEDALVGPEPKAHPPFPIAAPPPPPAQRPLCSVLQLGSPPPAPLPAPPLPSLTTLHP